MITDFAEQSVFQFQSFFLGRSYLFFQFFKFRGYETLCICKGLLSDKVFRNFFRLGTADFKVIAENTVVAHFEFSNACAGTLLLLKAKYQFFPISEKDNEFIKFFMVPF